LDLNTILSADLLPASRTWSLVEGQDLPAWVTLTTAGLLEIGAPFGETSGAYALKVQASAGATTLYGEIAVNLSDFGASWLADLTTMDVGSGVVERNLNSLVAGSLVSTAGRTWAFASGQLSSGTQGIALSASGTLSVGYDVPVGVRDVLVRVSSGSSYASGYLTLNAIRPSYPTTWTETISYPQDNTAKTLNLSQRFLGVVGRSGTWSLSQGAPVLPGVTLTAGGSLNLPGATLGVMGINHIYADFLSGGSLQTVKVDWVVSNFGDAWWSVDLSSPGASASLNLNNLVSPGTLYTPPYQWNFTPEQPMALTNGWTLTSSGTLSVGTSGTIPGGYMVSVSGRDSQNRPMLGILFYEVIKAPEFLGSLSAAVGQTSVQVLNLGTLQGVSPLAAGVSDTWTIIGGDAEDQPFCTVFKGLLFGENNLTAQPFASTASGVYRLLLQREISDRGFHSFQNGIVNVTVTGGTSSLVRGAAIIAGTSSVTVPSTSGLASGMAVSGAGILPGTTIASIDGPTRLSLSQPATVSQIGGTFTVAGTLVVP
ncbi:MAG: hypothetical protein EBS01_14150, partial [Verrucomicrobia bacterium]|nr:hypothetical protein [Verrucomicrobiota bacterium]